MLIDERIARNVAERMGLTVTDTLGILLKARELSLIESFAGAAHAIRRAGIFYNDALIARLAPLVGE